MTARTGKPWHGPHKKPAPSDNPSEHHAVACHSCWGSGEGDCAWRGGCSRCRGYGVEPERVDHVTHRHWGYGGAPRYNVELSPSETAQ